MVQANQHHDVSAMASYTEVIELLDVPPDVRAMALYNRALLHVNSKNYAKAQDDLNEILALPGSLPQIKLAAHQKLERMKLRQQRACPKQNSNEAAVKQSAATVASIKPRKLP